MAVGDKQFAQFAERLRDPLQGGFVVHYPDAVPGDGAALMQARFAIGRILRGFGNQRGQARMRAVRQHDQSGLRFERPDEP